MSVREHSILVLSVQGKPREGLEDMEDGRPVVIRHGVTAIGLMTIDVTSAEDGGEHYEIGEWRAGGTEATTEAELIAGFWKMFERMKPRLVTFNGRSYAMPLLRYRSMAHALSAPLYHAGDKSYGHRWSPWLHYDVMDRLCEHGASTMPSLADVSLLLGLDKPETRPGASGAAARKLAVLHAGLTAHAYLAMSLLSGTASRESVQAAREAIEKRASAITAS